MAPYTGRDAARDLSPPWLANGIARKILYAIAYPRDALVHLTVMAVQMRFPGFEFGLSGGGSTEALTVIGKDRQIFRGLIETAADYALRLRTWHDTKRTKGNPYTLMDQLAACLGGAAGMRMAIVNQSGLRFERAADGTRSHSNVAWDWDGQASLHSRFWLLIYSANHVGWPPVTFGDGQTLTPEDTGGSDDALGIQSDDGVSVLALVGELRAVVAAWVPAHAVCHSIIWCWSESVFSGMCPNGTWNLWQNRSINAAYMRGT